jgi:hypothetical protein
VFVGNSRHLAPNGNLANLFSGCESLLSRPPSTEIDAEAALLEALAEL